ncbi:MAG: nitrogen fixation protein [Methylocystaceae bacterium]|nr:nitrogen fixation protein [Methylocystaceae bacterium]
MLIALTSQNFKTVTKHAAKTRRFLVFKVDEKGQFSEVNRLDLPKDMSLHEVSRDVDHPIYLMDALIVGSCGENFKNRMASFNVDVHKTDLELPEDAIREYLQLKEAS